jgi:RNA polymerase sigma factor for flagellar operon FliA
VSVKAKNRQVKDDRCVAKMSWQQRAFREEVQMSQEKTREQEEVFVSETVRFNRDELIETYLPLINAVAQALASRLPACVDAEDLAGVGVMGLIDAIEKYDPAKCDNFKNYARIRIKGAMLDELRSLDWVPRSVRQVAARIERKRRSLEQDLGRMAEGEEVAEAMGVTVERYHELRDRALGTGMISFEDIGTENHPEQRSFLECLEDTGAVLPDDHTHQSEVKRALIKAIEGLPERDQYIISLYYLEGLNLKEIGAVLGVTESRISQIHTKALKTLKARIRKVLEKQAA